MGFVHLTHAVLGASGAVLDSADVLALRNGVHFLLMLVDLFHCSLCGDDKHRL